MGTVTSRDGTTIAFDRLGSGPALVCVDGALCHRAFGPTVGLAEVMAAHFTVYAYDRRGRGESGDTVPYAVAHEVEDLAAVIDEAGGSAYVYGMSSGAAIAMEAAASGLAITKLALFEPPYTAEDGDIQAVADDQAQLAALLAQGRRGDAVETFLGYVMPPEVIAQLRNSPAWSHLEAVAPTIAYDNAAIGDGTVPRDRAAQVETPTVVIDGEDSPDPVRRAAKRAADAIPGACYHTLEGLTHTSSPEPVVPVLRDFFT